MYVGEQPVWDATRWSATVAATRSLREQLRRAQNKGVAVRRSAPDELVAQRAAARWRSRRSSSAGGTTSRWRRWASSSTCSRSTSPPSGATSSPSATAASSASSPRCRSTRARGWLLEDFLRDPAAPNGTAELLIDAAMRALADEGSRYVTLGLAPLSGPVSGWLRAARRLSSPLYDFAGLRAFKAKLRPHEWEPIYLAYAPGSSSHVALVDALAAFARGSFLRFGGATLLRGPALVVRVLAALLVPWTALLALADARWFPARVGAGRLDRLRPDAGGGAVRAHLALAPLARRRGGVRHQRRRGGDAGAGDACGTRRTSHGLEWLLVAMGLVGPALAAVVLWGAVGHRRRPT